MYVHNYNQGSIYDVNRRQEREIKALKAENTRIHGCMDRLQGCVATAERDLRKARRTVKMQEAQMNNMQKENDRLRKNQKKYGSEITVVMSQSDKIRELQAEISKLVDENNSSASRTWVPIERYNKLEEKKDRFKKALAAELDGEDSTRIIDILTEEDPKSNESYWDIEATRVSGITGIRIHNSNNTWC